MHTQRQLRDQLEFVNEFSALFEVLQQVAVSQLRKAEEQARARAFVTELMRQDWLARLPAVCRSHGLVRGGPRGRLIVLVTSDQGFVGPLHGAVARQALAMADAATQWILVGQRGLRMLGAKVKPVAVLPIPAEDAADEAMRQCGRQIVARYLREGLQDSWMIAPRFLSTMHQDVRAERLLPLPVDPGNPRRDEELVLEPALDQVMEELALTWVEGACVEMFWSARRAEFAARALHVESSRQELAKHAKQLHHEFFKTLHTRMDVMVRETCVVQRDVARRRAASRAPVPVVIADQPGWAG